MENNFNTKDCITAVQHYADEHGKEEAYQSATCRIAPYGDK